MTRIQQHNDATAFLRELGEAVGDFFSWQSGLRDVVAIGFVRGEKELALIRTPTVAGKRQQNRVVASAFSDQFIQRGFDGIACHGLVSQRFGFDNTIQSTLAAQNFAQLLGVAVGPFEIDFRVLVLADADRQRAQRTAGLLFWRVHSTSLRGDCKPSPS